MTFESKIKARQIIGDNGRVSVTITDENDKFVEEKEYTNLDECVSDIEYFESIDYACYL